VRFACEWHDESGHWYRSYGNENWEFHDDGLMASRYASINDLPILEADRKYHWAFGPGPEGHPGLSDLRLQVKGHNMDERVGSLPQPPLVAATAKPEVATKSGLLLGAC
jgi:Protein of unknown function (DUF1348)